jgi:hypothetical protein
LTVPSDLPLIFRSLNFLTSQLAGPSKSFEDHEQDYGFLPGTPPDLFIDAAQN